MPTNVEPLNRGRHIVTRSPVTASKESMVPIPRSIFGIAGSYVIVVLMQGCGGGGEASSSTAAAPVLTQTYRVGGDVAGLTASTSLTLINDGKDPVTVHANGAFQFSATMSTGALYSVSIETQPEGQTCEVSNGSGAIDVANVTSVAVTCVPQSASGIHIRQLVQYNAYPGTDSSSWTVTVNNVAAGSTLYVVGTWPNFSSTYPTMQVVDGTNLYTQLDRYDDKTRFNLGIQGTQSMGHWFAANVAAGSYTVNMAPTSPTFEDWVGIVVIEVAGASSTPMDGHALNFQPSVAPALNAINATVRNQGLSGLLIAVSFDDIDFTAPTVELAGSQMTDAGPIWDFTRSGRPSGRVTYATVTSSGEHPALFTPQEQGPQAPDYLTCAAILQ